MDNPALQITMEEARNNLNEVVVVGYQARRRSDLTGAVSVVNVEGLSKLPVGGVDQALQGKATGSPDYTIYRPAG